MGSNDAIQNKGFKNFNVKVQTQTLSALQIQLVAMYAKMCFLKLKLTNPIRKYREEINY